MRIERFEDMEIWKEARELSRMVFVLTSNPPFCQDFRFRSQIQAAAGSVMDNIAEGFCRDGNKEFVQFLSIAKGSCGETRSQIQRAFDFGYVTSEQYGLLDSRTNSLMAMISGFMKYLKVSAMKGPKYHK